MSMDIIWPNRPQSAESVNRCKCSHLKNRHLQLSDSSKQVCEFVGCGCVRFRPETEVDTQ